MSQSSGVASGCGGGMLAALVAEAGGAAPVVFSDELSGAEADAPPPIATHLRHELDDDNAHTACLSMYNYLLFYMKCYSNDAHVECFYHRMVCLFVRSCCMRSNFYFNS